MIRHIVALCLAALIVAAACVIGCTENIRARNFGGTVNITLPPGQKLVVATWKEASLWYLTRPMRENEHAESYIFHEDSTYGVWQGAVNFREVETVVK